MTTLLQQTTTLGYVRTSYTPEIKECHRFISFGYRSNDRNYEHF